MGDHQDRPAFSVQFVEKSQDCFSRGRIEIARRFVGE